MDPRVEFLRWRILEAANEDVTPVYEAWWQANTDFPELAVGERLVLAERAVLSCVKDDLIVIEEGTWEKSSPVDKDKGITLLREWSTWAIPDGPTVFFFTTEKGKTAYRQGPPEPSGPWG